MPAQPSPPWTASSIRRRIGTPHSDLRVSDAERADVADRLGKHYADGRLDQDEFNERVDQAMHAKTQSDLSGLFDDLPVTEAEAVAAQPPARRRSRGGSRVLFLAMIIALTAVAGQAVIRPFISVLWIGMVGAIAVLLIMKLGHHHHDHPGQHGHDHHDHER